MKEQKVKNYIHAAKSAPFPVCVINEVLALYDIYLSPSKYPHFEPDGNTSTLLTLSEQ